MVERTTVRLPEDLLKGAKRKAAAEGRTLTSLLEEGLRLVTSQDQVSGKTKRVLPPISQATGGPTSGVDTTKLSGFEELEDLERFDRMKPSTS
jgi:hypothetical protein